MSTEIEALERFFAAVNRNDMQAITRDFDPDIVRIEAERADALKWADIEDQEAV